MYRGASRSQKLSRRRSTNYSPSSVQASAAVSLNSGFISSANAVLGSATTSTAPLTSCFGVSGKNVRRFSSASSSANLNSSDAASKNAPLPPLDSSVVSNITSDFGNATLPYRVRQILESLKLAAAVERNQENLATTTSQIAHALLSKRDLSVDDIINPAHLWTSTYDISSNAASDPSIETLTPDYGMDLEKQKLVSLQELLGLNADAYESLQKEVLESYGARTVSGDDALAEALSVDGASLTKHDAAAYYGHYSSAIDAVAPYFSLPVALEKQFIDEETSLGKKEPRYIGGALTFVQAGQLSPIATSDLPPTFTPNPVAVNYLAVAEAVLSNIVTSINDVAVALEKMSSPASLISLMESIGSNADVSVEDVDKLSSLSEEELDNVQTLLDAAKWGFTSTVSVPDFVAFLNSRAKVLSEVQKIVLNARNYKLHGNKLAAPTVEEVFGVIDTAVNDALKSPALSAFQKTSSARASYYFHAISRISTLSEEMNVAAARADAILAANLNRSPESIKIVIPPASEYANPGERYFSVTAPSMDGVINARIPLLSSYAITTPLRPGETLLGKFGSPMDTTEGLSVMEVSSSTSLVSQLDSANILAAETRASDLLSRGHIPTMFSPLSRVLTKEEWAQLDVHVRAALPDVSATVAPALRISELDSTKLTLQGHLTETLDYESKFAPRSLGFSSVGTSPTATHKESAVVEPVAPAGRLTDAAALAAQAVKNEALVDGELPRHTDHTEIPVVSMVNATAVQPSIIAAASTALGASDSTIMTTQLVRITHDSAPCERSRSQFVDYLTRTRQAALYLRRTSKALEDAAIHGDKLVQEGYLTPEELTERLAILKSTYDIPSLGLSALNALTEDTKVVSDELHSNEKREALVEAIAYPRALHSDASVFSTPLSILDLGYTHNFTKADDRHSHITAEELAVDREYASASSVARNALNKYLTPKAVSATLRNILNKTVTDPSMKAVERGRQADGPLKDAIFFTARSAIARKEVYAKASEGREPRISTLLPPPLSPSPGLNYFDDIRIISSRFGFHNVAETDNKSHSVVDLPLPGMVPTTKEETVLRDAVRFAAVSKLEAESSKKSESPTISYQAPGNMKNYISSQRHLMQETREKTFEKLKQMGVRHFSTQVVPKENGLPSLGIFTNQLATKEANSVNSTKRENPNSTLALYLHNHLAGTAVGSVAALPQTRPFHLDFAVRTLVASRLPTLSAAHDAAQSNEDVENLRVARNEAYKALLSWDTRTRDRHERLVSEGFDVTSDSVRAVLDSPIALSPPVSAVVPSIVAKSVDFNVFDTKSTKEVPLPLVGPSDYAATLTESPVARPSHSPSFDPSLQSAYARPYGGLIGSTIVLRRQMLNELVFVATMKARVSVGFLINTEIPKLAELGFRNSELRNPTAFKAAVPRVMRKIQAKYAEIMNRNSAVFNRRNLFHTHPRFVHNPEFFSDEDRYALPLNEDGTTAVSKKFNDQFMRQIESVFPELTGDQNLEDERIEALDVPSASDEKKSSEDAFDHPLPANPRDLPPSTFFIKGANSSLVAGPSKRTIVASVPKVPVNAGILERSKAQFPEFAAALTELDAENAKRHARFSKTRENVISSITNMLSSEEVSRKWWEFVHVPVPGYRSADHHRRLHHRMLEAVAVRDLGAVFALRAASEATRNSEGAPDFLAMEIAMDAAAEAGRIDLVLQKLIPEALSLRMKVTDPMLLSILKVAAVTGEVGLAEFASDMLLRSLNLKSVDDGMPRFIQQEQREKVKMIERMCALRMHCGATSGRPNDILKWFNKMITRKIEPSVSSTHLVFDAIHAEYENEQVPERQVQKLWTVVRAFPTLRSDYSILCRMLLVAAQSNVADVLGPIINSIMLIPSAKLNPALVVLAIERQFDRRLFRAFWETATLFDNFFRDSASEELVNYVDTLKEKCRVSMELKPEDSSSFVRYNGKEDYDSIMNEIEEEAKLSSRNEPETLQ